MKRRQRGFTLIELLIVIAIILIIAAIAIPRLLSARTTAVEGKAGAAMRTIGTGLVGYNTKFQVFPAALANLGGAACDTTAPTLTAGCFMDDQTANALVTPGVGQYSFTYTTTGGVFTLNGDPIASSSAHRHFYMDTGLTVHYSDTAAATATDPTL
jgi:type IV pilus assembly protein PilA